MDLVKILRSLEEFLYELLSWLVFYPRTLWRVLRNPAGVARYTRQQLQQPASEQFLEMVSPVLTLLLSILFAHGIEMAAQVPIIDEHDSPIAVTIFGTDQGLLLGRAFCYGLYSLVAAVWVMSRFRTRVDRNTLREPFFVQSYLVSPFALLCSTASVMVRTNDRGLLLAGAVLAVAITVWYLWAQTTTYRTLLNIGRLRAFAYAFISFLLVTLFLSVMAILMLTA